MKIGIITTKPEGPIAQVLGILMKESLGCETEVFLQDKFKPSLVSENSLDGLLVEGLDHPSEGFAISVRKNIPDHIKMCYLYYPKPKEDFSKYNITAVDMIDPDASLAKFKGYFTQ